MEVKNTSQLASKPTLRMLVYGGPGSGKTTIASTFPKPLLIVAKEEEQNQVSVADKGLPYLVISKWDDLNEVYSYVKDNLDKYETISFDTLSSLQDYAKEKILAKRGDGAKLEFDDWTRLADMLRAAVRGFNMLGLHVVAQVHEIEDKNEDGVVIKRFDLAGQFKNKVSREFNIIGYISQKSAGENLGTVQIRFRPATEDKEYAKSHYRSLPNYMADPSFEKIYELVATEMAGKNKENKINKKTK